jgi:glycosyltransferase involved in cell wall biosynthesis
MNLNKKKVCHLTTVHPAADTRIFIKECFSLARDGYEVHLVVPGSQDQYSNEIYIHALDKILGSRLKRMTKTVYDVYKKALEINTDIYHFHDPELMPVGLVLKAKGKKVIYDVHEDVPEQILSKEWIPYLIRKPISLIIKALESFTAKRIDAIVPATDFIAQRFKKYNKNVEAVQNFPILNEFIRSGKNLEDKKSPENYIAYIGGITKIRGIEEMVKAVEMANEKINVKLLLGGKFDNENLRREMENLPGWRYVEYLGWLDRKEVGEVLSKAKAGFVTLHPKPRYKVSLPVKMFEYMSAGVPVIASNFPLWREIIEGNRCGIIVDPLNIEEISQAIVELVKSNDENTKMGENGRKAVKEKYNWNLEEKKLLNIYQQLCNK